MSDDQASPMSLLEELDARQDEALRLLDELNQQAERLIADFMRVSAESEAA